MIVSISGSPAATSDPKATSMIPSVTGQVMTSDLIIAALLASLKSDHIPAAPVSDDAEVIGARGADAGP